MTILCQSPPVALPLNNLSCSTVQATTLMPYVLGVRIHIQNVRIEIMRKFAYADPDAEIRMWTSALKTCSADVDAKIRINMRI